MTSNLVAILAHEEDPHLPYVTRHLDTKPVIINTGRIPGGIGLTLHLDSDSPWLRIIVGDRTIDPTAIGGVWYRSVDVARLGDHDLDDYVLTDTGDKRAAVDYAKSALDRLTGSLTEMLTPDAVWVSPRHKLLRAEFKPLQVAVARRVGFRVPETIFTSDSREAEAFLRRLGVCVVKPMAAQPPAGYNQLTRVLTYADRPHISGLNITPHIFQQLIRPVREVRAAVVGYDVFASDVEDTDAQAAAEQGIRDWRHAFENGTFRATPTTLPPAIAGSCVAMVHAMGLLSGMFDLACDKQGRWWFFEMNPNGQWAFVDPETVDQIGYALARLLQIGHR